VIPQIGFGREKIARAAHGFQQSHGKKRLEREKLLKI
jgi:hypothetical protein